MVYNGISDAEMLNFLLDNGKLDAATIAQQIMMAKRNEVLSEHPYSIWLASDGFWKTKVKGSDGTKHLIKRKTKSEIEDVIVEFYSHSHNTFKQRFDVWIERQRDCARSENTILKYQSDYKRFFEGYPLENINIQDIDEVVLSRHIKQVLDDKKIPWRAFKDIMGYVNGVFTKSVRDRLIPENPCDYLDIDIFRKYCYIPPVKTTKQRTLTENDTHTLLNRVRNPRAHNVNRMCCFAVEMALNTGMRVGELAALMWDDIIADEDIMIIRRMERFDRASKTSQIILVKNGKERIFPLVPEIKNLLAEIQSYETEHGWLGEYVFQDSEGRLTKSKISDTTRNITMSDEFSGIKSIHAIRRTVNSKMKCGGVSTTLASSLLGHSERVNEQNYTYDIAELEEKKKIVENIINGTRYGTQN